MRKAVASAPGKVNLVLRSGAQGDDGYHQLLSVFEAVSLREYVLARTRRAPGIGVTTIGYRLPEFGRGNPEPSEELTKEYSRIPSEEHLAVRAAKVLQPLVAAKWGPTASGMELTVHKTIPAAGGMAGGSADAAATLVAVNELWELGLTRDQLESVGRTLGADVPACVRGGWSVGEGRGDVLEELAPVDAGPAHWWALAFSKEGLSTPAVFNQFDLMGLGSSQLPPAADYVAAKSSFTGPRVGEFFENDLAAPALALRPDLQKVGESAAGAGALAWMISGSGPTIAALAESPERAAQICETWEAERRAGENSLLGESVAWGPDVGARVEEDLPEWAAGRGE